MKSKKRLLAVFAVMCLAAGLALSVFAADVRIKVNVTGGSCSVNVTQNGTPITGSDCIYIFSSTAGTVNVNAVPSIGSYITVAGRSDTTGITLDISSEPAELAVDIAVIPIAPPSVSLAADTAKGGLYYSIGASSTASCMFDVIICDASGNQVSAFTTTSMSGDIPLSSNILASQVYTAKASQRVGSNGESGYGSLSNAAAAAPLPTEKHHLNVSVENGSINTASGEYAAGERINLLATPNKGFMFKEWSVTAGAVADIDNPSTYFTMPEGNAEVKAIFDKAYTLTVKAEEGGKALTEGGSYFSGTEISLVASCDDGYVFNGWITTDGGSFADSMQLETDFIMPEANTTVTAVFVTEKEAAATHVITLDSDDGGMASTNRNRAAKGESINIKAFAKDGYDFAGWTSTSNVVFADASAASTTFTMPDGDVTVYAAFTPNGKSSESTEDTSVDITAPVMQEKKSHLGLWIALGTTAGVIAIAAAVIAIYIERQEMTFGEFINKVFKKKK